MTRLALSLMLCLIAGCGPDQSAHPVGAATGRWLTASGNLEVEIASCGEALCGTVARVILDKGMSPDDGQKPSAEARPLLGLQIRQNFTRAGDGEWTGTIYNRDNGKTYDCIMTVASPDQLKIRPYVVLSLFGKTQIWTRLPDQAKRS
jgi:uncharacterized protein (DUF2147 family)